MEEGRTPFNVVLLIPPPPSLGRPIGSAGVLDQYTGARNRVGIGLSNRPARLHRLAESILGLLKSLKIAVSGCDTERR
jgi:hypothetical protein